jgi:hypothetical protein
MPAGLEGLEGGPSKLARSASERGSGAVGAATGAAGESAPLVMETESVSGCTGRVPWCRESQTLLTEVHVFRQRQARDMGGEKFWGEGIRGGGPGRPPLGRTLNWPRKGLGPVTFKKINTRHTLSLQKGHPRRGGREGGR